MNDFMDKLSFFKSAERRSVSPESASAMAERVRTINEFAGNLAMADRREFPQMFALENAQPEPSHTASLVHSNVAEISKLAEIRAREALTMVQEGISPLWPAQPATQPQPAQDAQIYDINRYNQALEAVDNIQREADRYGKAA